MYDPYTISSTLYVMVLSPTCTSCNWGNPTKNVSSMHNYAWNDVQSSKIHARCDFNLLIAWD